MVRPKSESEMPPQSPSSPVENPWGAVVSPNPDKPATLLPKNLSFTEIIREEQQQRETLVRATNKPLALIQVCKVLLPGTTISAFPHVRV